MTNGANWIKRELLRQELLLLTMKKEKGDPIVPQTVEQWLRDTIAELDKVCN